MKHLSPKYRKRRTPQQQREFRDALTPHIGKGKVIRVEITVSSNKAVDAPAAQE